MELERRDIQRTDFGQAKRGYDPVQVDRHLAAIAQAVEDLKSARSQSAPSLAGAAAERVESIVAAAEASASEIESKAKADAEQTRATAERTAAERVQAADDMVRRLEERAEEMLREVEEFVGRIGGLRGALDAIREDFDVTAPSVLESVPTEGIEPVATPEPEPEPESEPAAAPEAEPASDPEPVAAQADKKAPTGSNEGARLVALNMALSGTPREETARYLRENFDLDDQDDLLGEVYARAGS